MDRMLIHLLNAIIAFFIFLAVALLAKMAVEGWICAGPIGLVVFGILIYATYVPGREHEHMVLRKGKDYTDLGHGGMLLGIEKITSTVLWLDPRLRSETHEVRAQCKDGRFVNVTIRYSWKPDLEQLKDFYAVDAAEYVYNFMSVLVQANVKECYPADVLTLSWSPVAKNLTGFVCSQALIVNVSMEDGSDLSKHVRDNTDLIQTIVLQIEEETKVAEIRKMLEEAYPDHAAQIKSLCEHRAGALRKRGLK